MEPISDVLGTLVAELISMETGAGRGDRAADYEQTAMQAALPGFEFEAILTSISRH